MKKFYRSHLTESKGKVIKFYKSHIKESNEELYNPGIGWYHIYTWHIAPPYPDFFYIAEKKEKLVLLLIDIGYFRDKILPVQAINCIENILKYYSEQKIHMILRFVYDTDGKGIFKEPSDKSLIKFHMHQVGTILQKYYDSIACVQGIFVGSWGEMHGSRYLSDELIAELIEELDLAAGKKCFLAVRKPSQRRIIENGVKDNTLPQRIGIFNDGMFGSETDLGTYQNSDREQELNWQQNEIKHTYNGGEALAGKHLTGYFDAAKDMKKMHISYLNSIYQKDQLDFWKSETVSSNDCWNKICGRDYIGRRLGYRFVVRDVSLYESEILYILIENIGFANLCKEACCFIVFENLSGIKKFFEIKTDIRLWNSGETILLKTDLKEIEEIIKISGMYKVSIRLCLKSDREIIRFANCGAEECCFLGKIITRPL